MTMVSFLIGFNPSFDGRRPAGGTLPASKTVEDFAFLVHSYRRLADGVAAFCTAVFIPL